MKTSSRWSNIIFVYSSNDFIHGPVGVLIGMLQIASVFLVFWPLSTRSNLLFLWYQSSGYIG